jgi:hypothetical protein
VTDTQPRPFDERAALEELERLADRIQSTRRQRERAVAEFNAFVKTFKDEDHAARWQALQGSASAQASALPRATHVVVPEAAVPPPAPPTAERRSPEVPPPTPAPIAAPALESELQSMAWSAPLQEPQGRPEQSRGTPWRGADVAALLGSPRGRLAAGAAALLAVVLFVSWLWGGSGRGPDATPGDNRPAAVPSAQSPPATAPAQPTPVASTGPARALNVVLMTSRPVWTRVTVDDRKVIEREIPGGQTIPLGADRAIVIRAGDAGAIRVIVDGKDSGVLGRDGQIALRTFTAPAAR